MDKLKGLELVRGVDGDIIGWNQKDNGFFDVYSEEVLQRFMPNIEKAFGKEFTNITDNFGEGLGYPLFDFSEEDDLVLIQMRHEICKSPQSPAITEKAWFLVPSPELDPDGTNIVHVESSTVRYGLWNSTGNRLGSIIEEALSDTTGNTSIEKDVLFSPVVEEYKQPCC